MSRIPSSASTPAVAGRPGSSVYTLLLLIALVALVATTVYTGYVMNARFRYTMPFGDQYKAAKQAADKFGDDIRKDDRDVVEAKFDLTTGLSGSAAAPPAP